ncbi:MAG: glycosyltransferase [Candidatus Pacebacteria bacterium]|nr:glycosyltransferase [Candidatus Paceibacterota bacterium]
MSDSKRLKILFLPAWYPSKTNPVAGIFIKEHAKAVSLYDEVVVLYSEGCDKKLKKTWEVVSDKSEEGIRTIRIKYKKSPIPKTTYFIYLLSVYQAFKKILKEDWKPDIIHAHVYSAGLPAVILGRIYKIPVVLTEHFTAFPRRTLSRTEILKARFAMARAKIILPVSKDLEESIKSYGIKNNFEVVPNVVNTKIFYPSSNKQENEKNYKKRMLLVALLDPKKGISFLLEAIAKISKKRQDFVLDIVGDGPNRKEYEDLSQKLGIQNLVKFHGLKSKEEIAEFMRNCDFFVLPSLWENLPCVLIEAMASGLPIIATTVGGIPEIINEERGILIPPKNVDVLVKAIDYMLDHYQDYLPEKISQYAKENFSYEAVGKKLDNIYRKIK